MDMQVKSLNEVARELMVSADWNLDKALTLALERSKQEPNLTQEVLNIGWDQVLRHVGSEQRTFLETHTKAATDSNARIRRVMSESFLDTWLVNDKPLGGATEDDLRASIGRRKSRAETETKRAAFEQAILKGMKPKKKVKDCWNETDIANLAREHL